ncbi:predicted protein [Naegleria gruberi]|uniref:Predicted protein n=1 Tax=Naegleria gruberi TaxID=5762 RepID=D2W0M2_NAEGR|nr:uncharacterized protein NAEGRDRAFT_53758 [Naegleria gruberi]EFC37361.1 predicted protein [Naegleria gruberi]|eukprot:XP_002670105.1 predicted protein [Naegleria gruberi strain NEG-M]
MGDNMTLSNSSQDLILDKAPRHDDSKSTTGNIKDNIPVKFKKPIMSKKNLKQCGRVIGWIVYWLLIFAGWVAIAVQFGIMRASPVNPNNPEDYRKDLFIGKDYTVDKGYPALIVHAIGGILCLLIGILQFQDVIRRRVMIIHKIIGYIFSACVFIGFVGGLWLIPYSVGGVNTKVAFSLLSLIWIVTLGMALLYVTFAHKNPLVKHLPKGDRIQRHREWMIRCFSSVCAAITLRIYLFLFAGFYIAGNPNLSDTSYGILDAAQKEVYGASAWLAVSGNLIISEIYINMVVRKKIVNDGNLSSEMQVNPSKKF